MCSFLWWHHSRFYLSVTWSVLNIPLKVLIEKAGHGTGEMCGEGPRQIWRGFAWYARELRPNEIRAVSTQPSHHASLSHVTGSLVLTDLCFESVNSRHSEKAQVWGLCFAFLAFIRCQARLKKLSANSAFFGKLACSCWDKQCVNYLLHPPPEAPFPPWAEASGWLQGDQLSNFLLPAPASPGSNNDAIIFYLSRWDSAGENVS